MDCTQCGAPLSWDGYRPVIVCEFCRSMQSVPSATGQTVDRIAVLDSPAKSNCPRCEFPMSVAAVDGLKVEHCLECHGVLLENHQFATLVRQRRARFKGVPSQPVVMDQDQLKIVVDCPGCRRTMEVHPYYGPGNIVIDSCSHCRLVWLDSGEMTAIEQAPGKR
jgi:Zn-finger nucleic acid-binding protein